MKLLVFGKSGQVARELSVLRPDAIFLDRNQVDFAEPSQVAKALKYADADVIINAAAYTAVDAAEKNEELATTVNGTSVETLALEAKKAGIPLVHISTDYVFNGSGDVPWIETAETCPLSAYGRSKLKGETAVCEAGGVHAVIRTSWVFSAYGSNFVKTMLRLGSEKNKLRIIADQVGGPTPAAAIARTCVAVGEALKNGAPSGTYHYSGQPETSWAGFAREIFNAAGLDVEVEEVPTSAYPQDAKRPLNSRLSCAAIQTDYGIKRPDWRTDLQSVLKELMR